MKTKIKAFGLFWFDFIVGDDWRVALAVIAGVAATLLLAHHGQPSAWWPMPVAVAVLLPVSLWREARRVGSVGRPGRVRRRRR